jgi:hypothetical protein
MSEALQTKGETAMETFDDLIADAGRGTELIGANDVRPPRMMLCQSGSPQRKPDHPKQIIGLNELDLFNSLSNEIYGRSVRFTVIASLGSHWVEFNEDLTVADPNVPEGDPRTEFTTLADGTRVKPVATKFYDYLLWLVDQNEVVAFSLKSTQIKVAIKLNGMLKMPLKIGGQLINNPPSWARTYTLETKMESGKQYSWGGYNLSSGVTTPPELRAVISKLAKTFDGKKITVDREESDTVDGSSDSASPMDVSDM